VGSNARRIEAVTSMGAIEYVDERLALMDEAAATLKCRPADLPERVSQMRDELREAKHNIGVAKGSASGDVVAAALRNAKDLGTYRCVFTKLDGVSGKDLRSVWDSVRDGAKGEPCRLRRGVHHARWQGGAACRRHRDRSLRRLLRW
jgi:alanyl-tRNA synthetase